MKMQHCSDKRSRRGVTLVLAAFLMVMMLAMVAFAVDCGYMALCAASCRAPRIPQRWRPLR